MSQHILQAVAQGGAGGDLVGQLQREIFKNRAECHSIRETQKRLEGDIINLEQHSMYCQRVLHLVASSGLASSGQLVTTPNPLPQAVGVVPPPPTNIPTHIVDQCWRKIKNFKNMKTEIHQCYIDTECRALRKEVREMRRHIRQEHHAILLQLQSNQGK